MHRCLDRYLLTEPIASGAHGQVWRGRHIATDTCVAVKVLAGSAERFEAEAAAVARLDHPHILPILDLGRLDAPLADVAPADSPVLVMPWADGGTLSRAPLSIPRIKVVARQLLEALAHAHARGVLHLDVKPANVLLHDEDVLLADFSIASLGSDQGWVAGTPHYMAPEQLRGEPLSDATDRYALGCVVYQLLAGRPVFEGQGLKELGRQHLASVPRPLPDTVPPGLARWVATLLEKAPWRRFDTDRAAWEALEASPTDLASSTQPFVDAPTETLTMEGLLLDFGDDPVTDEPSRPPATPGPAVQCDANPPVRPRPPPLPEWREFPVPVRGRLDSVGNLSIQLLRLRTLPTVGRIRERDALWDALDKTVEHPAVVVVHGPPGSGTSHLGRWLLTLAVELGAARAAQLDEAIRPGRRGVCWLDDPDRSAQGQVLAALATPERGAVLYVLSMRSAPRGPLAALSTTIEIGPLSAEDHVVFTSQVLGLAPTSQAALFRSSSGLPGPTLDRIAQAVRAGALCENSGRWILDHAKLPTNDERALPDDPTHRIALTVAAAFDGAAAIDDWREGCHSQGLAHPDRLLPLLEPFLQRAGEVLLVRPEVRDSLPDTAAVLSRLADTSLGSRAERGRWKIAAGEPLEGARLLIEAVEHRVRGRSQTFQPWLAAAHDALQSTPKPHPLWARWHYIQGRRQAIYCRFDPAREQLCSLRTLAEAGAASSARVAALEAQLLHAQGDHAGCLDTSERALRAPETVALVRIHLHQLASYSSGALHDATGVHDHQAAATQVARRAALHQWEVGCMIDGAGWLGRLGDDRAADMSRRALRRAEALGLPELAALARVNVAESVLRTGDLEAARATFEQAEHDLASLGSIVALSVRLLRLCVALEQGAAVRTRLTALRRVFEGFPTAPVDLLRCRAAEALAAARESEPTRAIARAEEVAATLEQHPDLQLPVLTTLLAKLADAVEADRPDLAWIGRPPPPTGRPG